MTAVERLWLRLALVDPERVHANLLALHRAGRIDEVPTLFQVSLGVVYMWHRILFRPESIGVAPDAPVRRTLRARLFTRRWLRAPFLAREGLIHPREVTGLATAPEALRWHVLGAFHPEDHALYDLELLSAHPGELERLLEEARAIADGAHPRAAFLADLCVYEGYHARVVALCERALAGDLTPHHQGVPTDASVRSLLTWLLTQPRTAQEAWAAWRRGELRAWAPREA